MIRSIIAFFVTAVAAFGQSFTGTINATGGTIAANVFSNSFVYSPFNGWRQGHVSVNGNLTWTSQSYYTLADGFDFQMQSSPSGGTFTAVNSSAYGYGSYGQFQTGATAGYQCLWCNNAFNFQLPSGTLIGVWFFQLPSTATERVWFGFCQTGVANGALSSDNFGAYPISAFRYSTAAGDTHWMGYNNNGSAVVSASTGIAPDLNEHSAAICILATGSTILSIDGAAVLTNAQNSFGAGTNIQAFFGVATTAASAASINFYQMYWAQHF
jgi:hypothetical protein